MFQETTCAPAASALAARVAYADAKGEHKVRLDPVAKARADYWRGTFSTYVFPDAAPREIDAVATRLTDATLAARAAKTAPPRFAATSATSAKTSTKTSAPPSAPAAPPLPKPLSAPAVASPVPSRLPAAAAEELPDVPAERYRAAGVPINDLTRVGPMRNIKLEEVLTEGRSTDVFRAWWSPGPGRPLHKVVFKYPGCSPRIGQRAHLLAGRPERTGARLVPWICGLNLDATPAVVRNLLAPRVATMLGFPDVIPACQLGTDEDGVIGLVMECPDTGRIFGTAGGIQGGNSLANLDPGRLSDTDVRRSAIDAQIVNAIIGEAETNDTNLLVHLMVDDRERQNFAHVWSVDHCTAFAPAPHPDELAIVEHDERHGRNLRAVRLPPVMDRIQAGKLERVDLSAILKFVKPYLCEAEQAGLAARFHVCLAHVRKLDRQGRIIDPADWELAHVGGWLHDPHNNFIGRRLAYNLDRDFNEWTAQRREVARLEHAISGLTEACKPLSRVKSRLTAVLRRAPGPAADPVARRSTLRSEHKAAMEIFAGMATPRPWTDEDLAVARAARAPAQRELGKLVRSAMPRVGTPRRVLLERFGAPGWRNGDDSRWVYSLPLGQQAWALQFDAEHRVSKVERCLTQKNFALIHPGDSSHAVRARLGEAARVEDGPGDGSSSWHYPYVEGPQTWSVFRVEFDETMRVTGTSSDIDPDYTALSYTQHRARQRDTKQRMAS